MPRPSRARAPPAPAPSAPASAGPAASACSRRSPWPLVLHLSRVESLLEQGDEILLGRRRRGLVRIGRLALLADHEDDCELPARHLVQRLPEHVCVLRVLGETAVELRLGREL